MARDVETDAGNGGNKLGAGSRGSFVAVVGPSGAGKDSLLAIAAATLAPETGFFFPAASSPAPRSWTRKTTTA